MSRRVRTLVVSGVLFLGLLIVAMALPVPYVILSPGPTLNTLTVDDNGAQIITIDGATPQKTSGHLNLTTVGISQDKVDAVQALIGWLKHDQVVVPRASIYLPGQTEQQVNQQDTEDFTASQDSATAAALCELGYPKGYGVLAVTAGTGAVGKLDVGDALVSLDGQPIGTSDTLQAVLAKQTPNTTVHIVVTRAGTTKTVDVKLGAPPKGGTGARIGIAVGQACLAPFEVKLGLGGQIGGPSAGLMFALGIMDKVGTVDLTGGRFIAGTGEITPAGAVGPIGGIQLKMIAAKRAGATVFLAPAGNCTDVLGATPKGLQVVKVNTLHDAVTDLIELKSGKSVPHC